MLKLKCATVLSAAFIASCCFAAPALAQEDAAESASSADEAMIVAAVQGEVGVSGDDALAQENGANATELDGLAQGAGLVAEGAPAAGDPAAVPAPQAAEPAEQAEEAEPAPEGFRTVDGYTFYYEGGKAVVGEKQIADPATGKKYWYFFNDGKDRTDADEEAMPLGAMRKSTFVLLEDKGLELGKKWVYYDAEGRMLYGEQLIDGGWYYLQPGSGAVAYDFVLLDVKASEGGGKKWVYYGPEMADGRMRYGEQYIDGGWYYLQPGSGAVAYGFVLLEDKNVEGGKKWVYYGPEMADGRMRYGEQYIDGGWYYLTPGSGAVDYEWALIPTSNGGTKWVYYGPYMADGRMRHGWQTIDGERYWFDTYTGQSDIAQYYRWMLRTASGAVGIRFFNGGSIDSGSFSAVENAANAFFNKGYTLGYLMMDIRTGKGLCCNVDYRSYSASTIKGPFVASVYSRSLGGNMGSINSLYSTFSRTIVSSSNSDYAYLRSRFGSGNFANWLTSAGVDTSRASSNYTYLSARELGKMWLQMYSDFGKSPYGGSLGGLFTHSYNSAIYNTLGHRSGYWVQSKPGWMPAGSYSTTNDAGIVHSPEGDYLVVVLSSAPSRFDMVQNLVTALDRAHSSMV